MGSLSGTGIAVVNKFTTGNFSFRHQGRQLKKSATDTDIPNIVTSAEPVRAIGSGSIVSNSGVVTYYEELVVGMTLPGRVVDARAPREDLVQDRTLKVDLAGNTTQAIIPTSLSPDKPQEHTVNTGRRIVRRNSASDDGSSTGGLIDRIG
ncbi:unnamed protein product [marine sediment metagenome]|uniref:Uncharacterized protein n=1 Tax=marine sediment metagenome TaxID=412755 RepID=X0RJW1_9ZZZZ